jgi:uncharacterized surface protein with fasciclin (FAS1) repeats
MPAALRGENDMSHCVTLSRAVALAIPVTLGAWTVQAADLIQTAEQVGRFNSFLGLLEAAGMADMLKREGPFTVFAPTDEAFAQIPPGTLDRLLAEDELLQKAMQSHIVPDSAIAAGELLGQAVEVATLGGGTLAIDGTTGIIFLVPIEVSVTEVEGQTILEQKIVATPIFASVVESLRDSGAGPDHTATPVEQEPMGVATVIEPDIGADNGVIHGIDLLLLPSEVLRSL